MVEGKITLGPPSMVARPPVVRVEERVTRVPKPKVSPRFREETPMDIRFAPERWGAYDPSTGTIKYRTWGGIKETVFGEQGKFMTPYEKAGALASGIGTLPGVRTVVRKHELGHFKREGIVRPGEQVREPYLKREVGAWVAGFKPTKKPAIVKKVEPVRTVPPVGRIEPYKEPEKFIEKARYKLAIKSAELQRAREERKYATSFFGALGVGFAGEAVGAVGAVRHPVETVKATYGIVRHPKVAAVAFGKALRERPVEVAGAITGAVVIGKGLGVGIRKAPTVVGRLSPFYEKVPKVTTPELVTPAKLAKMKPSKVYHVTKEWPRTMIEKGVLKVKAPLKGMAAERKKVTKITGVPEAGLYVSPEKAVTGFGYKPPGAFPYAGGPAVRVGKRAVTRVKEYFTGPELFIYAVEKPKVARIPKRPVGVFGRAEVVRAGMRQPGKAVPGPKTIAGMGVEKEFLFLPPTKLYEKPGLRGRLYGLVGLKKGAGVTYDPVAGVMVEKFVLTPKKPKAAKLDLKKGLVGLKERYKPKEVFERFKKPKVEKVKKVKPARRDFVPKRRDFVPSIRRPIVITPRKPAAVIPRKPLVVTPRKPTVPTPRRPVAITPRRPAVVSKRGALVPPTKRVITPPVRRGMVPVGKAPITPPFAPVMPPRFDFFEPKFLAPLPFVGPPARYTPTVTGIVSEPVIGKAPGAGKAFAGGELRPVYIPKRKKKKGKKKGGKR